jgi:molybdate transport system permease protein
VNALGPGDLDAIQRTLTLAALSTLLLLSLSVPLALGVAKMRSRFRPLVEALIALPLVLPPTVLGFYVLILLGPEGPVGAAWEGLGGDRLVFSFSGLLIGSMLYSAPFVVQPLVNGFRAIDVGLLESATLLGASKWDRFWSVTWPLSRPALLTAGALGFAHTLGEFGLVLMIGGNIPGKTRLISMAIYDHVEALEYGQANTLALGMLTLCLLVLIAVYALNRRFTGVGAA